MTYFIPTTLVGMADATSSPTTFVGMVIPTKLLGTVYFDKSCLHSRVVGVNYVIAKLSPSPS